MTTPRIVTVLPFGPVAWKLTFPPAGTGLTVAVTVSAEPARGADDDVSASDVSATVCSEPEPAALT